MTGFGSLIFIRGALPMLPGHIRVIPIAVTACEIERQGGGMVFDPEHCMTGFEGDKAPPAWPAEVLRRHSGVVVRRLVPGRR